MPYKAAISSSTGRAPMSRSEAARHASLVRWKKEQPFAANVAERLAQIRAARLAKGKKGGGKGRAKAGKKKGGGKGTAAKPKEARTPQEKANRNRAAVSKQTGMGDLEGTLVRLGAGMRSDLEKDNHDKLIAKGLAQRGADGTVSLTAAGKQFRRAADKGDAEGAQAAIAAGQAKVGDKTAKEQAKTEKTVAREHARQQKQVERERAKAERVQAAAERVKAAKEKKAKAAAQSKEKAAPKVKLTPEEGRARVAEQMQANDTGITGAGLSALGKLSAGEGMADDVAAHLEPLGLVERDSEGKPRASTQARALLRAADKGDYGAALDAISRAKDRVSKKKKVAPDGQRMLGIPGVTKANEVTAMDLTAILHDLEALHEEAHATTDDAAIKIGKRNNGNDQAQLDHGYELAMQLCDLFEALGADTGEEDAEAGDEGEMGMDEEMGEGEMEMMAEGKAIAAREDVSPKAGLAAYGDVAFADQKNKKYPIDTADHVRAAWNYISKPDNAGKYAPAEVEQIKGKIVAAWKRLIDKAGPPSAETKKDADYLLDGGAIKALDGDRVGAYAVRFGSEDEPDMSAMHDYFTKATDFWLDAWDRRPMLYHHALDEDTQDAPRIGTWTKAEVKDEGVWLEGQLDRHHRYYTAIKELVKRGALRLSSDSAPHLVRRAMKADGVHEVTRWPIIGASLTPTPAEPRLTAVGFKALMAELGLNDIDNQEAQGADAARPGGAKAADDGRARALLLELELLSLEATTT